MELYFYEILREIHEVQADNKPDVYNPRTGAFGLSQITPLAWKELVAYFPEKYRNKKYPKDLLSPDVSNESGIDYMEITRTHMSFHKIPLTIENIVVAYNWGITNLVKNGIEKAPDDIKYYSKKIRKRLQPQAEALESEYNLKK